MNRTTRWTLGAAVLLTLPGFAAVAAERTVLTTSAIDFSTTLVCSATNVGSAPVTVRIQLLSPQTGEALYTLRIGDNHAPTRLRHGERVPLAVASRPVTAASASRVRLMPCARQHAARRRSPAAVRAYPKRAETDARRSSVEERRCPVGGATPWRYCGCGRTRPSGGMIIRPWRGQLYMCVSPSVQDVSRAARHRSGNSPGSRDAAVTPHLESSFFATLTMAAEARRQLRLASRHPVVGVTDTDRLDEAVLGLSGCGIPFLINCPFRHALQSRDECLISTSRLLLGSKR